MYEKVNPSHPDKIADRIAGAIVDMAYKMEENPKIAVEVLIGHNECTIITESSVVIPKKEIWKAVKRISGIKPRLNLIQNKQDVHLAENQENKIRCGDNGIFKGVPVTKEQRELTNFAVDLYKIYNTDGKFIINKGNYTICQSNCKESPLPYAKFNPLGYWTGGVNVDTGATNRKLGSDMGDSVTGGGLHGKDLSKADVSVNIYAFLKAQETGKPIELSCSIGDVKVDGKPYKYIVEQARQYIEKIGGFEKFAEWGLIR